MEKCVVLSDGDKLREIRKKYGIKQEELAGKEITRNLISEIENNKAPVTKKTAEIIIKNLTLLAKKKHFQVGETVDYLMENQIVQATNALDDYIEELKTLSISKDQSFIKILKEAESFLIDWDIKDKKLKIYDLAGDYYCNNNEPYKSVVYYEKALALISKMFLDRKLIPLSRKLSIVYGRIGNYEKSIECCNFALNSFKDMQQKDKVTFIYNNALNYYNMKNFEKSLNNFKFAENIVNKNDDMYIKILNNKANCLYEMKSYKEALIVFNTIFKLVDRNSTEKYLVILINIVNTYWFAGLKDMSIQNFDIVINELPNLNNNSLCIGNIYFEIGQIYKRLDKLGLSEEYYLKALNFSNKQKNYTLATDILCALIELYSFSNDVKKMNTIKDEVLLISKLQNKINSVLMFKLIAFYIEKNNNIIREITNFVLKLNEGELIC